MVQAAYTLVADITTANPLGGGVFTGFGLGDYSPALEEGVVAFVGGNASHPGSHFSSTASGGPISSVVTYGTSIPGEPSQPTPTYISFGGGSLDGGTVAFAGLGWESGQSSGVLVGGLYTAAVSTGALTARANSQTSIPAYGGSFIPTSYSSPSADKGQLVFHARSSIENQAGIYLTTAGGLQVVANKFSTIPGGAGTFPGGFGTNPMLDAGEVVFSAQIKASGPIDAIFKTTGRGTGPLEKVVDSTDTVPGSTEKFAATALPVMSAGNIAFWGSTIFAKSGIYASVGGSLRLVADQTTDIPGGPGKFIAFENNYSLAIHGNRVVFLGFGGNSQVGIYLWDSGALQKLVDSNDLIDSRGVRLLEFGREAFDGKHLVFTANFDGNYFQGIYTIPVDAGVGPLSGVVLKIEHTSLDAIQLAWPGTVVDAQLESSTTLRPGSWSSVPAPVTPVNGENVVIEPRGTTGLFYRLAPR